MTLLRLTLSPVTSPPNQHHQILQRALLNQLPLHFNCWIKSFIFYIFFFQSVSNTKESCLLFRQHLKMENKMSRGSTSISIQAADRISATSADSHSVLLWLVCQSTRARFTLPAQIWWACSHLFMRSESDLNGWHSKQSHIWAGSWNPACVDTPISVEPSVWLHLTQSWSTQRCPNRSNTWGWSHMEQNVCRAESCVMRHRMEGGMEREKKGMMKRQAKEIMDEREESTGRQRISEIRKKK